MTPGERVRFAVLSDIHADTTVNRDTYVSAEPPPSTPRQQPMADLLGFIESRDDLKVDSVLCPGDLSNKSSDQGKLYGWSMLQRIAAALDAESVIATPGNHDIETHRHVPDPAAILKTLAPSYPTGVPAVDAGFWARGFALVESEHYRVLTLNSCYNFPVHPGTFGDDEEERRYKAALDKGSFSEQMQTELTTVLAGLDEKAVNILLCHHHPLEHQLSEFFKDTYGPMDRGGELVDMLDHATNCGRWTVVHGHKHVPQLSVAGYSANSPILFCSASLGGQLWHPIVTVTRNQFHILEFEIDRAPRLARTRGTIRSFMWGYGAGWKAAQDMSGLPARCGFGMIHDHRDLADRVVTFMRDNALEFVRWEALSIEVPELRYQGPRDMELFDEHLSVLGYTLQRDRHGNLLEVAREVSRS